MRGIAPILMLFLAAVPVWAQESDADEDFSGEEDPAAMEFTEEQKALIIQAIVENGCQIDEEGAQRLMPPLNIDTMVFSGVVSQLMADQQATMSIETETLTLAPELCQ